MRCLERDPAVRYQDADEILVDLQGAQIYRSRTCLSRRRRYADGPDSNSRIHGIKRVDLGRWRGHCSLAVLTFAIPRSGT